MNFTQILISLNALEDTSSKNEKEVLLEGFLEDAHFRMVCTLALCKQYHFHMKKLPNPTAGMLRTSKALTIEEVFTTLFQFAGYRGLSNQEKQNFADMVSNAGEHAVTVVNRIVNKDLRCGVKESLINNARPGTIPVWPYMRCRSHTATNEKKIIFPCYGQLKANGLHIDIVKNEEEIIFVSRAGNNFDFLGQLDEESSKLFEGKEDGVFIGEGLVLGPNGYTFLDRKTGNGIINKALKGTISKAEASRIRVQLWEFVPYADFFDDTSELEYAESMNIVEEACRNNKKFRPIEYKILENMGEAVAYFREVKERGLEGLVLKNFAGAFVSTNVGSPNQMKLKAVAGEEFEADFKIVGINPGEPGTRFENGVGSLQYISAGADVIGNVGSGISHEERDYWKEDDVVGKIATIRFDEMIQDKRDKNRWSLYAPRLIEIREPSDKSSADDLSHLLELTGG